MDTIKETIKIFANYDFNVNNYFYIAKGFVFRIEKDFSKRFNIKFNGTVILDSYIYFDYDYNNVNTYPVFIEINDVIPKQIHYHVNPNGELCITYYERPKREKWELKNFVNALNSMLNNYFNKEFVGSKTLQELEHGVTGRQQYYKMVILK